MMSGMRSCNGRINALAGVVTIVHVSRTSPSGDSQRSVSAASANTASSFIAMR